jgi:hypothetical protein
MLYSSALEARLFRALNALVEPVVRAGWGSPGLAPAGLILLETRGRRTGRLHRVPVLATLIGEHLLVGTARGDRSDWVRNAGVSPGVRFWLHGRAREATALVFRPDEGPPDTETLPPVVRHLAANLHPAASALGMAFAILVPLHAEPQYACSHQRPLVRSS